MTSKIFLNINAHVFSLYQSFFLTQSVMYYLFFVFVMYFPADDNVIMRNNLHTFFKVDRGNTTEEYLVLSERVTIHWCYYNS